MNSFNKNPKTPYECFEYVMNIFFLFLEDEDIKLVDKESLEFSEKNRLSALKVLEIGKTIDIKESSEVDYTKLIKVLDSTEEEDVRNVLSAYFIVLNLFRRIFGEDVDEESAKKIGQCEIVYLEVQSEFHVWSDPEKYKKTLRRICNNSIELADTFIYEAGDHEDSEFGFELKNKSLAARAKIKIVKADPASMDFVHEYLGLMNEEEKDFFMKEILGSFIDRVYMVKFQVLDKFTKKGILCKI